MGKVRDSGMPAEEMWVTFFDPDRILSCFGIGAATGDVVEFGCGYGTFTLPLAKRVSGMVHALDIEPEMVAQVRSKSQDAGLMTVRVDMRDFVAEGSGLSDGSVDAVLLFNILHHAKPVALLSEAFRILAPGGIAAVIHWNHDPATPRGPSLEIRPRPEQCVFWGKAAGFTANDEDRFDLPPYHYEILFRKPA